MKRLPAEYFEKIYAHEPDPWGFDSRWYEARKYALTLAALPRERYERVFEPGCANGALTEKLALRCEKLVAAELVSSVATRARKRLRKLPNVDVRELAIPDEWPEGGFDLIVLSEVTYYLTDDGVTDLLDRIDASLTPGGHVITVNFRGEMDSPLEAAAIDRRFDVHTSLEKISHHEERAFALSVYERSSA